AGPQLAVEFRSEALELGEHGEPQIRYHPLADRLRQDPLAVGEKAPKDCYDDDRQTTHGEEFHPVRREDPAHPAHESARLSVEQDTVNDPLNRPGSNKVGGDERQHETGRKGKAPPMRLQKGAEADEEPGDPADPGGAHRLTLASCLPSTAFRKTSESWTALLRMSKSFSSRPLAAAAL